VKSRVALEKGTATHSRTGPHSECNGNWTRTKQILFPKKGNHLLPWVNIMRRGEFTGIQLRSACPPSRPQVSIAANRHMPGRIQHYIANCFWEDIEIAEFLVIKFEIRHSYHGGSSFTEYILLGGKIFLPLGSWFDFSFGFVSSVPLKLVCIFSRKETLIASKCFAIIGKYIKYRFRFSCNVAR